MFATKQAVQQHKAAKPNVGRRRAVKAPALGAAVSTTQRTRVVSSESATLSGTDILATVSDVSTFSTGSLLVSELVTAGSMPRLRTVARAFQKVRFNKLIFRVEPQISTGTSGGYVAAFVRDPADKPPSKEGLSSFLLAQHGAVTTKWWESSVVNSGVKNTQYYTSESAEIREFSPGSFMLAATGVATQKGNLVVYVEWSVTLSQAAFENERQVAEEPQLLMDTWMQYTMQGIFGKKPDGGFVSDTVSIISHPNSGPWRLPAPISVKDGKDEASMAVRPAHFFAASGKNLRLAFTSVTDLMVNNALDTVMLFPKGTPLVSLKAAPAALNLPGCSSQGLQQTETSSELKFKPSREVSEMCSMASEELMITCSSLSKLCETLKELSSLSLAQLPSRELCKSTESQQSSEEFCVINASQT